LFSLPTHNLEKQDAEAIMQSTKNSHFSIIPRFLSATPHNVTLWQVNPRPCLKIATPWWSFISVVGLGFRVRCHNWS